MYVTKSALCRVDHFYGAFVNVMIPSTATESVCLSLVRYEKVTN